MTSYQITVNGKSFVVSVGDVSTSPVQVVVNGVAKSVAFGEAVAAAPAVVAAPAPFPAPAPQAMPADSVGGAKINAPMPGKILSITIKVGDSVTEGDTVCTLEAMKMEMPISSTASGTVKAIHVNVGDNVAFDDPLVTLG